MTKRYVDSGEACIEDYTEKRYKFINPNNLFKDMNIGIVKDNTCILKLVDVVNLLNEQEEQIRKLEKVNEDIVRIKKENKQLKEALKEAIIFRPFNLGDEIDKKIAILTDAKIKAFHNGDEELFGKVKFSIQVLRELKEAIL